MPRGFESHRLRQEQHPAGCCFLFLQQTLQGLQGGIRTARARRLASRRAATVLRTVARARENPTVCAKSSTLRGVAFYFCNKLCKGCKVGFEQSAPGALRPAGQKCPGGAFLGRGKIRASAPKAAPCGVLLIIFAANYARVARWDSNSPCPALCVPPGCNSPADCCKGAGESHRLRQVSLLNSTLGSDFLLLVCKIPLEAYIVSGVFWYK